VFGLDNVPDLPQTQGFSMIDALNFLGSATGKKHKFEVDKIFYAFYQFQGQG